MEKIVQGKDGKRLAVAGRYEQGNLLSTQEITQRFIKNEVSGSEVLLDTSGARFNRHRGTEYVLDLGDQNVLKIGVIFYPNTCPSYGQWGGLVIDRQKRKYGETGSPAYFLLKEVCDLLQGWEKVEVREIWPEFSVLEKTESVFEARDKLLGQ